MPPLYAIDIFHQVDNLEERDLIQIQCITSRPHIFEPTEESGNLSNFFIKVMYSLMSPLSSGLGCQMQKPLQIITPKLLHIKYYNNYEYKDIDESHKYCQIRISMCKKTLTSSRRRISLINTRLFDILIIIQIWYHLIYKLVCTSQGCSISHIVKVYNQTNKAFPLTLAGEGGDKNKGVSPMI